MSFTDSVSKFRKLQEIVNYNEYKPAYSPDKVNAVAQKAGSTLSANLPKGQNQVNAPAKSLMRARNNRNIVDKTVTNRFDKISAARNGGAMPSPWGRIALDR